MPCLDFITKWSQMLGVLSETITRDMEHMFSEKKSSLAETDLTLVPTDFWTSMRRAWHFLDAFFPFFSSEFPTTSARFFWCELGHLLPLPSLTRFVGLFLSWVEVDKAQKMTKNKWAGPRDRSARWAGRRRHLRPFYPCDPRANLSH